jgi:hypothetical protein
MWITGIKKYVFGSLVFAGGSGLVLHDTTGLVLPQPMPALVAKCLLLKRVCILHASLRP